MSAHAWIAFALAMLLGASKRSHWIVALTLALMVGATA